MDLPTLPRQHWQQLLRDMNVVEPDSPEALERYWLVRTVSRIRPPESEPRLTSLVVGALVGVVLLAVLYYFTVVGNPHAVTIPLEKTVWPAW